MARIGNVSAVLTVNSDAFQRGLDAAERQLSAFGRNVSSAFGEALPASQFSAAELELMRFSDNVKAAEKSLVMPQANESINALKGSLFLVTGQTGFFAVEAARAASHITKLTAATGGFTAAIAAAGLAAKGFLVTIGPVGWAILGAGAAYAAASYVIQKETDALVAKEKELIAQFEREKPSLDSLMQSRWKAAEALGKMSKEELRRREMLLSDENMKPSTAAAIVKNDTLVEQVNRGKEILSMARQEREMAAKTRAEKKQSYADEMNAIDLKYRIMADHEQYQSDIEAARAAQTLEADHKRFAQNALVSANAAKPSQFESDPFLKQIMQIQERMDALKSDNTKTGADFAISSMQFRGNVPMGDIFGQQREQAKVVDKLTEQNELTRELIDVAKNLGGVTIE